MNVNATGPTETTQVDQLAVQTDQLGVQEDQLVVQTSQLDTLNDQLAALASILQSQGDVLVKLAEISVVQDAQLQAQEKLQLEADGVALLRRIARIMDQQSATDLAQRQRVVVDAVANMTTLTNLTQLFNIDSYRGYELFAFNARLAYNTGIRAKLV